MPNRPSSSSRIEHDSLGDVSVPSAALYGAETQRAVENFSISGLRLQREFIQALGWIKAASARTNARLKDISPVDASAIEAAADAIAAGDYDEQFVVDVFQTGSGTSTNMNANELIAHICAQSGNRIHPNDVVNRNQSSNDVFPAAIHLAVATLVRSRLLPALRKLRTGLAEKAGQFQDVLKVGRTHLQDAVPMRLGDEFSGYARQVELSIDRIQAAMPGIYELPLGGTAIGTGVNAPASFGPMVIADLASRTGLPFREATNHFEAQASKDALGFLSGGLRSCAISLSKIANDIRWLASGPRAGLGELQLPAVQPGSSIMPGKVNPVIAESLLMACVQVIGHDAAIAWACASGNFELNSMMPLLAWNMLDSINLLSASAVNFQERCVRELQANRDRALSNVDRSLANVTMLVPHIGYDRAAAIAQEAYRTNRTIYEVAREQSGISESTLRLLLDPKIQAGRRAERGFTHVLSAEEKVDFMSEQSFPASDAPAH